ncbi:carbamoyltransferase [Polynucleobacter sp. HIN9]|uniref:carbamoyltransferase family protein n=1 Tax=Polynucleobacter sp. HIN9 TaxID=3047868 RepID=UPI00257266D2|nr:carbamoyltransferase [Polynucleobacter sp. HIN9]BEI40377.1 carbamoyltransferase [Polynucleobacter sp. HIN9]
MNILGISAYYHDSAAALVRDGEIIAAAQEERFTRMKHDSCFPRNAITFCLNHSGVGADEIDFVVFYDKPFLKFERLLETYVSFAPHGFSQFRIAMPIWLRDKLFLKNLLCKELTKFNKQVDWRARLLFSEHHLSHAASAFFPSPFKESAVLTLDGVGEWATTSLAIGSGNNLEIIKEINFPNSLGLLYSAFTYYIGFRVNSGEYKVMGLAPYGEPKYADIIYKNLIDIKPDGSFRLNQDYFDYCAGLTMINNRFENLFGGKRRDPAEEITQRHMDLAASIQAVTEDVMLRLTRSIAKETRMKNLCLAGGVALNCVANGKILRDGQFENIWIQPAAGDAGGALGAALSAYYIHSRQPRVVNYEGDCMKGSYLGPSFSQKEIESRLNKLGAKFETLKDDIIFKICAQDISEGKTIGWFQGQMEFGPRALGARSILGDPRSPTMQKTLNLKVKFRESFRPFAPSILQEHVNDWFELDRESPYMLFVADIVKSRRIKNSEQVNQLFGIERLNLVRSEVPAITHIDYSARIQTVSKDTNQRYYTLLTEFYALTNCPILVNTSFNVRGEPIVNTPEDAFNCFMGTDIDILAIGNCYLKKENQDQALMRNYEMAFELD